MAPVTVTLRWKGHSQADASTQYEIQSDVATPNTYVAFTTRAATTPYTPVSTTLAGAIVAGATSLTMTNASLFANNDQINIDREAFNIFGKSGNTFGNVIGGIYGTIPQDHKDGSFVYKMHETTNVSGVDFGTRHVVRYRIIAILGTVRLVAAEAVAVSPSLPSTNDKITIWGIQDRLDGTPRSGVHVTMTVGAKAFAPGTAESLDTDQLTADTDPSGYWQIITTKDVAKSGGTIGLNIGGVAYTLKTLPDLDTINYLECI